MTIKNGFLKQSDNLERKSSLTLSFRLCFLFLIVRILTPLGQAKTLSKDIDPISFLEFSLRPGLQNVNIPNALEYSNASFNILETPMQIAKLSDQWQTQIENSIALNLTTQVGKKPSDLLFAKNPTTHFSNQLWQARITNPKDEKDNKGKNELQQIIRQINSVEFKPQYQTSKSLIVVEPIRKTEPGETLSDSDVPQEPEPKKANVEIEASFNSKRQDEKHLYKQITNQTLQMFEQLSKQPQQLKKPLELAEILFRNNSLKESAKCYQEALNRIDANKDNRQKERAWILFQIGNCLRNTDRPAAIERYKQLVAEYPDSPWADLTKSRIMLIDWYQQNKPGELIVKTSELLKNF